MNKNIAKEIIDAVNTADEWALGTDSMAARCALYRTALMGIRRKIGDDACDQAESYYSIGEVLEKWASVLQTQSIPDTYVGDLSLTYAAMGCDHLSRCGKPHPIKVHSVARSWEEYRRGL